jgi:hypothetical protein
MTITQRCCCCFCREIESTRNRQRRLTGRERENDEIEIRFVRTAEIKKSARSSSIASVCLCEYEWGCEPADRQIIHAKLDLSSLSLAFLSRQERERERAQANNFISHLTICTESRIFFFFFVVVVFFLLVFFFFSVFFSLLLDAS